MNSHPRCNGPGCKQEAVCGGDDGAGYCSKECNDWVADRAERDQLKAELAEEVELFEQILRHGTYCGELDATDLADVIRDWLAKHKPECETCGGEKLVDHPLGIQRDPCPDCAGGEG